VDTGAEARLNSATRGRERADGAVMRWGRDIGVQRSREAKWAHLEAGRCVVLVKDGQTSEATWPGHRRVQSGRRGC
jgi:hypothetical protein